MLEKQFLNPYFRLFGKYYASIHATIYS
uniref:Uncharacterized protein n=1 Tax=Rhizophora mucronata TaxID=61149 RepID=A0A2P2NV80_RHIMU